MKHQKKVRFFLTAALAVVAIAGGILLAHPGGRFHSAAPQGKKTPVLKDLSQMPLLFIENKGQTDQRVDFYLKGKSKTVYFTSEGATFSLFSPDSQAMQEPTAPLKRWNVKLDYIGENTGVKPVAGDPAPTKISYFKGKKSEWQTGLNTYASLAYKELWKGIDLEYSGHSDKLEYKFIVHPGADPKQIQLAYSGAESIQLNDRGELEINTPAGSFVDQAPLVYQEKAGRREIIEASYALERGLRAGQARFGFTLGAYDKNLPLIIDPAVVIYGGFIGGSGDETGSAIAVDSSGNAYVGGYTSSTQASFPDVAGPDLTSNGSYDGFVAKVSSDGTSLIYAGFIGGSATDTVYAIAVDAGGNAYVTGVTESSDFPVTVGPDFTYGGQQEGYVAKVNAAGTSLDYAGYVGGSGNEAGAGIAVDADGSAYVTGETDSTQSSFPVTVGPDLTQNGGYDAYVVKVSPDGTSFEYAGFIGGSGITDGGRGIAVDASENAYVGGITNSSEATFPETVGPDLTFGGLNDAFVAKISSSGASLVYAGYVGGSSVEDAMSIAIDASGSAYITGHTEGNFPVVVGPDLTFNGGGYDAFVAKVNPSGAMLDYAGYIGGSGDEIGDAIAVGADGSAYVTGWTTSTESNFPVLDGPGATSNGSFDAFVSKVSVTGDSFVYSGFIGGSAVDQGNAIAVDGDGGAYVAGITRSDEVSFPMTIGPDLTANGGDEAFVVKIANSCGNSVVDGGEECDDGNFANGDGCSDACMIEILPLLQNAYRWRNDDGTETSATFAEAENTPLSLEKESTKRLRVGVANGGADAELVRKAAIALGPQADYVEFSAVDTANGFAYFGTCNGAPDMLVKVSLSTFARVDTLVLDAGDYCLVGQGAIDPINHFLYFGTSGGDPINIIKVDLDTFTRADAISLPGSDSIYTQVIDPVNGFAYFGLYSSPGEILKVRLSDFTVVDSLALDAGENLPYNATIDTANGFAYLSTYTSPAQVIKIDLSDFSHADAITLNPGENSPDTAVIDTINGFLYFGLSQSPAIVVKVDLSSFTRAGALTFNAGENQVTSSAIDVSAGFAYFGTYTSPARVVKVDLSDFSRADALTLSAGEDNLYNSLVIDPANGFLYGATDTSPSRAVKIDLSGFMRDEGITFVAESVAQAVALDVPNDFGYFGISTAPATIAKVRLSDFTRVDDLVLQDGEDFVDTAFIDSAREFLYVGTQNSPGKIIKIRLSDFTEVDSLDFQPGEAFGGAYSVAYDAANNVAYYGTGDAPGIVIKVDLDTFTEVDSIALNAGEDILYALALDSAHGYLYPVTQSTPSYVIKIRLSDFTRVDTLTLPLSEDQVEWAVVDQAGDYLYAMPFNFGIPDRVVKIALDAFTRVGALLLSTGDGTEGPFASVIDHANDFLYTTTYGTPSSTVIKIKLSDFTEANSLMLEAGETSPYAIALDSVNGQIYMGTDSGQMIKVSVAPKHQYRLEYGENATSCDAIATWTEVPAVANTEAFSLSSIGVPSGTVTTNVAGALSDGSPAFHSGVVLSASAETSPLSLGEREFTELEYGIKATNNAVTDANYCFRLTDAGDDSLFGYTQYAQAQVIVAAPPQSGGGGVHPAAPAAPIGSPEPTVQSGAYDLTLNLHVVKAGTYNLKFWTPGNRTAARLARSVTTNASGDATLTLRQFNPGRYDVTLERPNTLRVALNDKDIRTNPYSLSFNALRFGDLNADGKIDLPDFSLFLTWIKSGNAAQKSLIDFNDDGSVDLFDLATLLRNWGDGE